MSTNFKLWTGMLASFAAGFSASGAMWGDDPILRLLQIFLVIILIPMSAANLLNWKKDSLPQEAQDE